MNGLKNLSVTTKITISFILFLLMLVLAGGVSLFQLIQVNTALVNVTDNLSVQKDLTDNLRSQLAIVMNFGNKYINTTTSAYLSRYEEESKTLASTLTELESKSQASPERSQQISDFRAKFTAYQTACNELNFTVTDRSDLFNNKMDPDNLNLNSKYDELIGLLAGEDNASIRENVYQARAGYLKKRTLSVAYFYSGNYKFARDYSWESAILKKAH